MSLPPAIEREPDLDRWIIFNEDGTVTVCTGKVEIGQGIKTAIAMIAAEELDVNVDRIRVRTADTERTANEFMTAGSMSVEDSGSAVRVAGATARTYLLTLAAEVLGVQPATLSVQDGTVTSTESNEQTDFWTLQGGHPFAISIRETPELKATQHYRIVGHKQQRLDIPDKVQGNVAFVHDMMLPHMPSPKATTLSDAPYSEMCRIVLTFTFRAWSFRAAEYRDC